MIPVPYCYTAQFDDQTRVERVDIPYEETTLPGYFFSADAVGTPPQPTFLMVNGSDDALSSLWSHGAATALARGYNALMFDGPGQQSMLFERGVGFRPDWEAVVTPVVNYLLERPDVDPRRIVLYGISQGGFWGARALAFEHRIAAAILDPGVVDVSASWTASIPNSLMKLFRTGKKEALDRDMASA